MPDASASTCHAFSNCPSSLPRHWLGLSLAAVVAWPAFANQTPEPRHGPVKSPPLLSVSVIGGWDARQPCQAGSFPLLVIYEDGTVLSDGRGEWRRSRLTPTELRDLREAARKALGGHFRETLDVSQATDAPVVTLSCGKSLGSCEVSVRDLHLDDEASNASLSRVAPEMTRLLEVMRSIRRKPSSAFMLPAASVFVADLKRPCAFDCPWPKRWGDPYIGVRRVTLPRGSLEDLDSEWRELCPKDVGSRRPIGHAFCRGAAQLMWCARPVLPGTTRQ